MYPVPFNPFNPIFFTNVSSAMAAKPKNQTSSIKKTTKNLQTLKPGSKSGKKNQPWSVLKGLLSCKYEKEQPSIEEEEEESGKRSCKKMKCSGSLCNNTKITQRPETTTTAGSPETRKKIRGSSSILRSSSEFSSSSSSRRALKVPVLQELSNNGAVVSATSSSLSASSRWSISNNGGSFSMRRLSGCYECRMVIDPVLGITTRDPSLRATICPCPHCGEIFTKPEYLELHQAVSHAVSELGPEDTSKNIVEIIFKSSWLKKQTPKLHRILKVNNTQKTISKFEEYRDSIKSKSTNLSKKHPRCVADGNELLRFHCTTLACSLGLNGSSNLCNSIPQCNVCSIVKNRFKVAVESAGGKGILTTATSGKAHDKVGTVDGGEEKRAMLVCRVIAGRVKKSLEGGVEEYDSMGGGLGVYSNLDELYVFNPLAILPCFVVVYEYDGF